MNQKFLPACNPWAPAPALQSCYKAPSHPLGLEAMNTVAHLNNCVRCELRSTWTIWWGIIIVITEGTLSLHILHVKFNLQPTCSKPCRQYAGSWRVGAVSTPGLLIAVCRRSVPGYVLSTHAPYDKIRVLNSVLPVCNGVCVGHRTALPTQFACRHRDACVYCMPIFGPRPVQRCLPGQ